MSTIAGKVVAITGAAHGVGAATARLLVAGGAKVVLVDMDAAALQALSAELGAQATIAVVGDVTFLDDMHEAVERALEVYGGIDIVIVNAGMTEFGSVMRIDPDVFARVVDVNLLGVFHTARAAMSTLIERRGYLLVVSSVDAILPVPGLSAYSAATAGASHLADCIRLEVEQFGVDVGVAYLSRIDTGLVEAAEAGHSPFQLVPKIFPSFMRQSPTEQKCAETVVEGLRQRARHVYVPRWMSWFDFLDAAVNTRVASLAFGRRIPGLLARLDGAAAGSSLPRAVRAPAPARVGTRHRA
ncbi:short-chain dehydrogenase/reductase [Nocardia asteroides]|uniref:short-chain dehydrogenase/reductase n=1 Tax=Nocardia asteroides TaxID=1824 RepID=UPI00342905F7